MIKLCKETIFTHAKPITNKSLSWKVPYPTFSIASSTVNVSSANENYKHNKWLTIIRYNHFNWSNASNNNIRYRRLHYFFDFGLYFGAFSLPILFSWPIPSLRPCSSFVLSTVSSLSAILRLFSLFEIYNPKDVKFPFW